MNARPRKVQKLAQGHTARLEGARSELRISSVHFQVSRNDRPGNKAGGSGREIGSRVEGQTLWAAGWPGLRA